jgi:hypothetical protein
LAFIPKAKQVLLPVDQHRHMQLLAAADKTKKHN